MMARNRELGAISQRLRERTTKQLFLFTTDDSPEFLHQREFPNCYRKLSARIEPSGGVTFSLVNKGIVPREVSFSIDFVVIDPSTAISSPTPAAPQRSSSSSPALAITQPWSNCCGDGIHADDPSKEERKGERLAQPCPGCRACR